MPLEQPVRIGQTFPQLPQLLLSFWRFRQPPSQPVNPGAQHLPFEQLVFAGQEIPQPPQFIGSVRVDSHPVTQQASPAIQTSAHAAQLVALIGVQVPPQQRSVPAEQLLPQLPQFASSFGTQLPPQHRVPPVQTTPHAPQLLGSVIRSAQTGLPVVLQQVCVPVQSGKQSSQAPSPGAWHMLAQQTGVVPPHCRVQLPHAFAELRVSTHAPPQHVVLVGQALPQALQLPLSICRSLHCELQHSRPTPQSLLQPLQ